MMKDKKLIAGIVLTGGGSKLKHIRQLTEYVTGMDVRIGYSNEHIVGAKSEEISGPEYATSVGLLMKGLEDLENRQKNNNFENLVQDNLVEVLHPSTKEGTTSKELETAISEIVTPQEVIIEEVVKPIPVKKPTEMYDDLIDGNVGEVSDTRRPEKEKGRGFFSKWTDKFIQMINETE